MNTKTLLIGASIGIITLGSLSFAAINGKWSRQIDETVKAAVESNNYAALSDTAKSKITQEQFAQMVARRTKHQAVESAIEAGDYTAFKNAMIAQIPTEAEFQKMVAAHKERAQVQAKIETAVKNNDFTAFKTSIEAQKAQMVANHPDMGNGPSKSLSDEKLQKHFDSLVTYYKENSTLPEMGKGFGPAGKSSKWMEHGPRGGRGE